MLALPALTRWCLKVESLPETRLQGRMLVEAPVSTNIGIRESSSVSQSRLTGAWSAALGGILGWNGDGAGLGFRKGEDWGVLVLCGGRVSGGQVLRAGGDLGGGGRLLVLGAPPPALTLEGAGMLTALCLLPEPVVEPAQLRLGLHGGWKASSCLWTSCWPAWRVSRTLPLVDACSQPLPSGCWWRSGTAWCRLRGWQAHQWTDPSWTPAAPRWLVASGKETGTDYNSTCSRFRAAGSGWRQGAGGAGHIGQIAHGASQTIGSRTSSSPSPPGSW